MLLSYPCFPPYSSVNQRRRLQDDCMLNGRLSYGLCKFYVTWRFSQGCNQTRTHPKHTGQSSNSSTWPNLYLSNSPKAALAAYPMEDQLQGCYTDIQSPWIRQTVISFIENRYRRCRSITTIIDWHSTVGSFPHKLNIGARAFRHAAPSIWICLSFDVHTASTVSTFKSRLKTFYFQQAFQ